MRIDNTVTLFLAWLATKRFGDRGDGVFNSTSFSNVLSDLFGIPNQDGLIVKLILSGRSGITQLGDSHWRVDWT